VAGQNTERLARLDSANADEQDGGARGNRRDSVLKTEDLASWGTTLADRRAHDEIGQPRISPTEP
jgi:hypothetical protein